MSEDAESRYLRAREVLRDSGWVFDDFVDAETRKWLASNPADAKGREEAYTRARVALEIKLQLQAEVEEFEGGLLINERRGRSKEDRTQ